MRSNGMGVSLTRAIPIFITMPGMTIGRLLLDSMQGRPDDLLDRHVSQIRFTRCRSGWLTPRHLSELRPHRSGTEGGEMNPSSVQLASQSFGKARHVSLGRRVNREIRDRKKAGRGTDIQNRAAFLFDHGRQQSACQPCQGHHVDLHHLVNPLRIGGRKCAHVSKSGVVDQQIDRGLLAVRPGNQFVDRLALRQIDWPDFDPQSTDAARSVPHAIPPAALCAARRARASRRVRRVGARTRARSPPKRR